MIKVSIEVNRVKKQPIIGRDVDLDLEETLLDSEVDLKAALRSIRDQGVDFGDDTEESTSVSVDETVVEHDLQGLKEALAKIRRSDQVKKVRRQAIVPTPDLELDETPIQEAAELNESLAKLRKANDIDSELEVDQTLVDNDQVALQEALAKIRRGEF